MSARFHVAVNATNPNESVVVRIDETGQGAVIAHATPFQGQAIANALNKQLGSVETHITKLETRVHAGLSTDSCALPKCGVTRQFHSQESPSIDHEFVEANAMACARCGHRVSAPVHDSLGYVGGDNDEIEYAPDKHAFEPPRGDKN
jgi:hypothetical protein